ncbi:MAG: dTDP-glucose 4,6-dehydratase [Armatimonadetes bacterium]|nr:dTDP-glucose 4,6-dehydratase [Armatimonadota bacterium]NIM24961.1 dTDP-glucose 4,6-dehydratase [Armatimonadota bacterium]NIM68847.1 dTDP-glucose 4,6-dehydratase [Armatimonadota bacterium]NIM77084.1 dTDP-glucose 4,6-dehydratase [Armatimonadota bacterium]NIN07054.1 dTDP-glucose 4,6-dehydratase [Armatimonadota bacterium]
MKILITGGAGFIGSNFIHYLIHTRPDWEIVNLDKLTYAGNLANLKDVEKDPLYKFIKGDICHPADVKKAMAGCDMVVNFAAESHVDRSIEEPGSFLRTDILGVQVLLEEAKRIGVKRFVQISTDEVYGSIAKGAFKETDSLNPSSPYSASKAGGELLARSYWVTYGMPVIITRAANNIGPYQYPEKVVSLFATNALENKELPVYGDGLQVRDYMHVYDHCTALDLILKEGKFGEIYNIGAGNEMPNLEMAKFILRELGKPERLIRHVTDRPGHDRRYALDCKKLRALDWQPEYDAEQALRDTVRWYAENRWWWEPIKSGEFRQYYERMYGKR